MESGEQRAESGNENVRVNRRSLLEFFDERVPKSRGHASAVVAVCGEDLGMGLMRHYFVSKGARVETHKRCTQGTPSGVRLDGWLRVTLDDEDTLYQVEIKNWSAHAIFGVELPANCTPDFLVDYKVGRWLQQWDDKDGIKQRALAKVLTPMRPPDHWSAIPVEPLACFWTALHPTGGEECFFSQELPVKTPWCSRLWVFSMSAYLRSLDEPFIELQMPDTRARMAWLGELIVEADNTWRRCDTVRDWGPLDPRPIQCNDCRHGIPYTATCTAFPKRIPDEIWNGEHDHHKPYPGDGGILFASKPTGG